ncbi:MAG: hypothetical protein V3U67_10630 [Gemmatimonadota bacterium]
MGSLVQCQLCRKPVEGTIIMGYFIAVSGDLPQEMPTPLNTQLLQLVLCLACGREIGKTIAELRAA